MCIRDRFVSCDADSNCVIVDPAAAGLRSLSAPDTSTRAIPTVVGDTVVSLALTGKDGRSGQVYAAVEQAWQLIGDIPTGDFGEATPVGAGEWLLVLSPDQPPVAVSVASGEWHQFDEWPMTGVRNPNTVWTGTELIVWGGEDSQAAEGAIWTPPSR